MADPVIFDSNSAKRIGAAVRRVEGSIGGGKKGALPRFTPGESMKVMIMSPCDGGGKYFLRIMRPSSTEDITADTDATGADFGTPYAPTDDDVKIIGVCAAELNAPGSHRLDNGLIVDAKFGRYNKDDRNLIVHLLPVLLPKPPRKYLDYIPISDTLRPTWTEGRVQG